MDQDIKELLEVNIELSQENNKMLKKIRSVQKRAALLTYLRWIAVIGIAFGAYYYVQPYFVKMTGLLGSVSGIEGLSNLGKNLDTGKINELLKKF